MDVAAKLRSSVWKLHQACGVCSGSPKDRWVRQLLQKADPRFRCGQGTRTGLTGLGNQSDRFGHGAVGSRRSRGHVSGSHAWRRDYARCDCWASVRWKGCQDSKYALRGVVSSRGYSSHLPPLEELIYKLGGRVVAAISWALGFSFALSIFSF